MMPRFRIIYGDLVVSAAGTKGRAIRLALNNYRQISALLIVEKWNSKTRAYERLESFYSDKITKISS